MRHVLCAAVVVFALTGCGTAAQTPIAHTKPAPPQQATLGWQEVYGSPGQRLVFRVRSLLVGENGWTASVAVQNDSTVRFAVATGSTSLDSSFGLMILPTGDHRELDRLNRAGELPQVRVADAIRPALPGVLEPGATWRGTLSARGAVPGGFWTRVVFGSFVAMGTPPKGLTERVIWITDHTHKLRARPQGTRVLSSGSPTRPAKSESAAASSR